MRGANGSPTVAVVQIVLSLDRGGLETMAVDLAIALRERGVPSAIIALDGGGVLEQTLGDAGIEYVVMNGRRFKDPRFHVELAGQLRRFGPCVAHTHMFAPLFHSLPALALARVRGIVHTEHSFEYLEPRPDLRRTLRWMSRTTRAFTLVGKRMRPYYADTVRISARRLQVIPNGIDARRYQVNTDPSAIRAELGLPRNAFIVGSAGRLAPEKNYRMLLDAVARCRSKGSSIHVALFGEGAERSALEARAHELGIGEAVSLLGWRTDLHRVLGALDLFVLTSDSEGLPLALLEAMATGLPSVSTPVGDIPHILEEARTGFFVPVGDVEALANRLGELARDETARGVMGRLARAAVAERFSHDAMVHRYITAYGLNPSDVPAQSPPVHSMLTRDAIQ